MNGKEPACQCRRHGDAGLILGSRKSPGGGHGNPSQYACLESLMDRGAWWAAVHGVAKGWTWLKWLSRHQLWTLIFRRFPWALLQPQWAWGFPGANGLNPSRAYFFYLVPRIPCPEPQATCLCRSPPRLPALGRMVPPVGKDPLLSMGCVV